MRKLISLIILVIFSTTVKSFLIVGKPQRAQTIQQIARKSVGELIFFTSSILFIRGFSPIWTNTDKRYHSILTLVGILGIGSAQKAQVELDLKDVSMKNKRDKIFRSLILTGKETNLSRAINWDLVYQKIKDECHEDDELNSIESCAFHQLHLERNNLPKEIGSESLTLNLNGNEFLSTPYNESSLYDSTFGSYSKIYEIFPGEFFLVTTNQGFNTWVSFNNSGHLFIWSH